MTIIAYRDGILAADSGAWYGDAFLGHGNKIDVLPDASLLATSGTWSDGELAREWFSGDQTGERPKMDDSFGGLLVRPGGLVLQLGSKCIPFELRAPFHADGSGHEIAIGAMHMGATAIQAVEAACEWSSRCRGPVQWHRISMIAKAAA